ncbi:hypothetical protein FIBSPDRAFT_846668 [Athelia psychrophila]|uniref:RPEL repeat protein n=1 Tax=Athelia psychrophila TaxID=1759441 RepID=A0A166X8V9_9AGAM|nr:hypothetical protein FIBSPDRAFT_846668 [Fibularhizoctonia sp. CBS 109695]
MYSNPTAAALPAPDRKTSFDQNLVGSLEKQLNARPQKDELVERNILRDDSVAPALQAARERLQKQQLQVGHSRHSLEHEV